MLIAQLNRVAINYLRALIIQWLAQIYLFDFKVRYILGKQYIAVDALLQRLRHPKDTKSNGEEEDINNQILFKLGAYKICPIRLKDN